MNPATAVLTVQSILSRNHLLNNLAQAHQTVVGSSSTILLRRPITLILSYTPSQIQMVLPTPERSALGTNMRVGAQALPHWFNGRMISLASIKRLAPGYLTTLGLARKRIQTIHASSACMQTSLSRATLPPIAKLVDMITASILSALRGDIIVVLGANL